MTGLKHIRKADRGGIRKAYAAHDEGIVHRDLKPGQHHGDRRRQCQDPRFGCPRFGPGETHGAGASGWRRDTDRDRIRAANQTILGTFSYMSPSRAAQTSSASDPCCTRCSPERARSKGTRRSRLRTAEPGLRLTAKTECGTFQRNGGCSRRMGVSRETRTYACPCRGHSVMFGHLPYIPGL